MQITGRDKSSGRPATPHKFVQNIQIFGEVLALADQAAYRSASRELLF